MPRRKSQESGSRGWECSRLAKGGEGVCVEKRSLNGDLDQEKFTHADTWGKGIPGSENNLCKSYQGAASKAASEVVAE